MVRVAGVVDADAHVDETDATWEYMTAEEASYFKPISVDPGRPIQRGDLRPHRLWLVDGRARFRRTRNDERTGTTAALRELLDVPARVRHMDELGVEVQVLYPTFLLGAPSPVPEVELAIYRSYNRWLADRTAETNGRLRWVLMPPLRSMAEALEELQWGKEHGAVGVFKRAVECDGKRVNDPYFYPLYEAAMRLDLPICMHTGGEDFANPEAGNVRGFGGVLPANITCFSALAAGRVPDRFPTLRFGVIEAMASWVPYVIADFKAKYLYSGGHRADSDNPIDLKEDFLRMNRFYVTCQTSDDIPYLLTHGAEDTLMVGTDYSHDDQSGVLGALNFIEQLGEDGAIPMTAARKILVDNPRAFYGL
jgi:predicted TIM-barrel fold metal-dependent hydrolase